MFILSGVEEELFPSKMSFESPEDMEEERRLFYVAITRARKRVNISYAQNRYNWGVPPLPASPAVFCVDIDQKFLEMPEDTMGRQPTRKQERENAWDYDYAGKSRSHDEFCFQILSFFRIYAGNRKTRA